jgi:hypothetical protein
MLASASSRVLPWEMQPGSIEHSATIQPSSHALGAVLAPRAFPELALRVDDFLT